jgi:hypothetical protein
MKMKTPEIVLQIRNGCLVHIATNGQPVKIVLIDWDNIEVGDISYPNENSLYDPDYEFNDLAKYLKENKPEDLKKYLKLDEFFEENGFFIKRYSDDNPIGICGETNCSMEIDLDIQPFTIEQFIKVVNNFNIDEHIESFRKYPSYKEKFTIRESVNDFEDFHNRLKELITKLNNI